MKFLNQDKTIFDAVSANGGKAAQGEKILPAPEEPMNKDAVKGSAAEDTTNTWINEKLHKPDEGKPAEAAPEPAEAAKEPEPAAAPAEAPAPEAAEAPPVNHATKDFAMGLAKVEKVEPPAPAPVAVPVETPPANPVELVKPQVKSVDARDIGAKPAAKAEKPKAAKAEKPAKASGGSAMVQLGAYRSEDEAKKAWSQAAKKYAALAGKSPTIVRADLGDKGVYYRLRAGVADAKATCAKLSAAGQACIVVK
jgi:hypothetical protein